MATNKERHAGEFHWAIELNVDCPYCGATFDANTMDDFSEQLRGIQVCEAVTDREAECAECGKTFRFDIAGGT